MMEKEEKGKDDPLYSFKICAVETFSVHIVLLCKGLELILGEGEGEE